MRMDVLTIFPKMFPPVLGTSILKRAIAKKVVSVKVHDLRDWSTDRHRKVDDRPYGGGPGMVMRPEPFFEAVDDLLKQAEGRGGRGHSEGSSPVRPHVVLLSPQGEKLTQSRVERLAILPWLVLLCGHYEGVDERVRQHLADSEISIGDYVLTCGELPAMVLIDSVVRLLPGALGHKQSAQEDSFSANLLEYPHYTRPREYRGLRVPEILFTGDSAAIRRWRKLQALHRTKSRRPELFHGSENKGD